MEIISSFKYNLISVLKSFIYIAVTVSRPIIGMSFFFR